MIAATGRPPSRGQPPGRVKQEDEAEDGDDELDRVTEPDAVDGGLLGRRAVDVYIERVTSKRKRGGEEQRDDHEQPSDGITRAFRGDQGTDRAVREKDRNIERKLLEERRLARRERHATCAEAEEHDDRVERERDRVKCRGNDRGQPHRQKSRDGLSENRYGLLHVPILGRQGWPGEAGVSEPEVWKLVAW